MGDVLDDAREHGNDDLRHRAASRSSSSARPDAAHASGPRPAEAGGRNRRRLLRAEEDRRAGADVHARRPGAAQPLHARLHADGAGRQGAQARSPDEAGRAWTARARKSYIASRGASRRNAIRHDRMLSEQEFRLRGRPARSRSCSARCCRWPTSDGFEVELQNGVLQVVFEEPSPAKFVVSPNAPVRQIWVSAMSRSFKLAWSPEASGFALDGETLQGARYSSRRSASRPKLDRVWF